MSEELKPCLFCGRISVVTAVHGSPEALKCINPDCVIFCDLFPSEKWNSAYCWKELSKRDEVIKKLREHLAAIIKEIETAESMDSFITYEESVKVLDETKGAGE